MRIAIHQPNFIPNFPFFYKMAMADIFVILQQPQFEKNNYQNRYYLNDKAKWVNNKTERIFDKKYTDGSQLTYINLLWINAIKETLGITTEIVFDYPTRLTGTNRLIDIIKNYSGDTYITSESAKDKYLDESAIISAGIEIEYCKVPKRLQKHIFEVFEDLGIDGTINQLPKKEYACKA